MSPSHPTQSSDLVGVKCECCRNPDKTQNLMLVGHYRRLIEVWRCDKCGQPCSNRRCDGFQAGSFEEGAR